MPLLDQLALQLIRLDQKSYGAYKQIRGRWSADELDLCIDHVQGDPFATPSRVRIRVPSRVHGIDPALWTKGVRRTAATDYILRRFASASREAATRSGSGHSGKVIVDEGDDTILARSGCAFDGDVLELRFRVGLPARGRRIQGRAASQLLVTDLPRIAESVRAETLDLDAMRRFVEVAEDHAGIQAVLGERGLVAFVANGSILPRATGVSTRPLADAVPFSSPPELQVQIETRHHGVKEGMGIPTGVTLITGGGFHGKTTLLEALQCGVYPHVPGDGREFVATQPGAVKVRSEDGRSVVGVDLSSFIRDLPGRRDTTAFTSPDASGSTSLAAAILESLEVGATALLLDEDTSATNLLIRDARMQALVRRETITPLIDRVRQLHRELGVSTLLVVGGSGDYLEVADHVVLMEDYLPHEVTPRAREIVAAQPTHRAVQAEDGPLTVTPRRPQPDSFDPARATKRRVRARGVRELRFGDETVELSGLEQLVDDSQARAVGVLLEWLSANGRGGETVAEMVDAAVANAAARGLFSIQPLPELAAIRPLELAGTLNRLRALRVDG